MATNDHFSFFFWSRFCLASARPSMTADEDEAKHFHSGHPFLSAPKKFLPHYILSEQS
jgi:hypothetical protein